MLPFSLDAQLSEPNTEEVYGGRILSITGYDRTPDTTRIYITTESANSAFYTDVTHNGSVASFGSFNVMPSMSAMANLGSDIHVAAVHSSGVFFFVKNNELYQTHADSGMAISLSHMGVSSITVRDSVLMFLAGNMLHFGLLDVNGNFTEGINSPLTTSMGGMGRKRILVEASSKLVYLFEEGMAPDTAHLYKLSDSYYSLSNMTSVANISTSGLSSVNWTSCGIGPDGRLFLGGGDFNNLYFAHTDNDTLWTEVNTGVQGAGGGNFAFSDTAAIYRVYSGKMYNAGNGDSTWREFGTAGKETHPNDGVVFHDPNFNDIVYMTTDMGLGSSETGGESIFEVNDGIEAVQVKGIDMTASKTMAWVASKSGIRQVTNYQTVPSWSNAIYPMGDGSPYFSVGMNPADSSTVYVGNHKVYKTVDGGANWVKVFSATDAPYNYPEFGDIGDITIASSIEVCPYDTNIVMVGYHRGDSLGGLFVSEDAGVSWDQILIEASVDGEDINVRDITFYLDSIDTVAYIAAQYDSTFQQGRSVYRVVKTSGGWVAAQDMDAANTTVGYQITATIRDLSLAGDTLYACGTDASNNHPIAYYRDLGDSTAKWDVMTTLGFPFIQGKKGRAITVGIDTVYCAVDNEIYFIENGGSGWQMGYMYPQGTEINFLYYDELLVGTGTGLYGHSGTGGAVTKVEDASWALEKGYVKVYPNPVHDNLFIENTSDEDILVSVYDLSGRTIERFKMSTGTKAFNTSRLATGQYIIHLNSIKGSWAEKLMFVK